MGWNGFVLWNPVERRLSGMIAQFLMHRKGGREIKL
jgi:cytochrome c biogenesis factor